MAMQINKYSVSKDTAALLTCLEELSEVHNHVYSAIALHYSEEQAEDIGQRITLSLMEARESIYEIIKGIIEENLCSSEDKKEI